MEEDNLREMMGFLNLALNDYRPTLDENGHSALKRFILKHGWYRTAPQINQQFSNNKRSFGWSGFEGANRAGKDWPYDLETGVYVGFTVNGIRDGYGIMLCTDTGNHLPELFECEWENGIPVGQGRYIWIDKVEKWHWYEGDINNTYILNGQGKQFHEDGHHYEGDFMMGYRHG